MLRRHDEFVGPGRRPSRRCSDGAADRISRGIVHRLLAGLRAGELVVSDPLGTRRFGDGRGSPRRIDVADLAAYRAVVTGGGAGLGRAWFEGWWGTDDLTGTLRLLARNLGPIERMGMRIDRAIRPLADPVRLFRRPDPRRDREHIHAHYDLGNEFFELFLDETMMYSAALFERADMTLTDASRAKLDRLCHKLAIGPGDHVLEIGAGWGGFALHAAQRYGARVTTTTIAEEQAEYSRERVAEAGLGDRIVVLDVDYRELRGRYDKVVSIEMIEAVDWREHDTFFRACGELLEPDGAMALQAIVIDDGRYEYRKHRRDYVKRYIFPGGCLPSISALATSVARATDLRITHLEDIGLHYAETLRRWRRNLEERRDRLHVLGLDRRFERMWDFYLAECEAGFLERHISDVQLVLAKPGWRTPGLADVPSDRGWRGEN